MRARASPLPLPVSSASGARARPRWVADVEGESIFSLKTVGVWHERGGRRRTLEEQDGEGGYEQYVLFEALLGAQGAASTRFREGVLRLREKLEEDGVDMDAIGERPWYLDDDEALLEGLKSAGAAGFELPSGDNLRAAQEILDTELKASPDAARLARARQEVLVLVRAGLLPETCLSMDKESVWANRATREDLAARELQRRDFTEKVKSVRERNASRKAMRTLFAELGVDSDSDSGGASWSGSEQGSESGGYAAAATTPATADAAAMDFDAFAEKRAAMLERRKSLLRSQQEGQET